MSHHVFADTADKASLSIYINSADDVLKAILYSTHDMLMLLCTALHHGWHATPRAASGPGRVLHRAYDAVPRRRRSARCVGLHFVLDGAVWREWPLNHLTPRGCQSQTFGLGSPRLFTAYRLTDSLLTARLPWPSLHPNNNYNTQVRKANACWIMEPETGFVDPCGPNVVW